MLSFLNLLRVVVATAVSFKSQQNVSADIELPTFFANDMVLQRGNASIWGRCPEQAAVELTVMAGGTVVFRAGVTSDANGQFTIPVLGVGAQNSTTVIINSTSSTTDVTLYNVAFGDVYLCSGQSNMEYPVANAFNGADERAHHAHFPHLRLLTVARAQTSAPATDASSLAPYVWGVSAPENISPRVNGSFGTPYPSAVCFFAVRELLRDPPGAPRQRFPIGIITITVGGTPIEAWSSASSILDGTPSVYGGNGTCGGTVPPPNASHRPANGNGTCNPHSRGASSLYNGMIAPFLPMRISAILWYQGEANDHKDNACYGPTWYRCLFPSMIQHWRSAFRAPKLPFVYVLLAGGHTAVMREAQYQGAGKIPLTGFASAMDLGAFGHEYLVPGHPPRKQEVGRRLSLLLRDLVYGPDHTVSPQSRGPRVSEEAVTVTQEVTDQAIRTRETMTTTTAKIPFELAQNVRGSLHLNGTGSCPVATKSAEACCNNNTDHSSHLVAFADPDDREAGIFPAGKVVVDASANTIVATLVSAQFGVTAHNRVEVRFMFDNNPSCALYAGALSGPDSVYATHPHFGLPAEMWRGVVAVTTNQL